LYFILIFYHLTIKENFSILMQVDNRNRNIHRVVDKKGSPI